MDKLTTDCIAAKTAGMSYGQWKATQERKEIPVNTDLPAGWKLCEWCRTPYKPTSRRPQRFCQPYCANLAFKDRKRKENLSARKDADNGKA
jgi:hypothetical protein